MNIDTYEFQSDFFRRHIAKGRAQGEAQGRAQGEAEGRAAAVLEILAARGVDVPEQAQARIFGCIDTDQLDIWIRRAVTADRADDLFA